MLIKNIELKNFRSYIELKLDFVAQKTLIVGANGVGKTNLLEALYYLSSLNSVKIKKDSELIMFGQDCSTVRGTVYKNDTEIDLEVLINPPKNKVFKVNGLKKAKSAEFIRVLSVVNFSVNDLLLLRGEPAFRRKWLDLAICQIYPVYSEKITKYNKIRLQKAKLLEIGAHSEMLDVFNQQLATVGANIIYLRQKFLKELGKIAALKHANIAEGEELRLVYETIDTGACVNTPSAADIETALKEALENAKQQEIRRCQCLIGPHRDDISFYINEIDAKKFASQGQQRTIVLALKLAELEIIKEKLATPPVLLLDDVLAELDVNRQNYLLNTIESDIQTIITCTDTKAFSGDFLKTLQIVKIEQGAVV